MKYRVKQTTKNGLIKFIPQIKKSFFSRWQNLNNLDYYNQADAEKAIQAHSTWTLPELYRKAKFFFIILLVLGCSTQKKADKWIPKLKKWGYLQSDTTFIPGDSIKGETKYIRDSVEIERLVEKLNDTCISKTQIKRLIKQIPCTIKGVYVDSARFSLQIWSDSSGNVKYALKINPTQSIKSNTHVCPNPFNWWRVVAIVLFILLAVLIFKR